MTLDGFLTFLGLALAVFALVNPVAQLRLRLQLGRQVVLAIIAICLVLYLEFFDLLGFPCPAILGSVCPWITFKDDGKFTPQMAAFFVVLAWMVAAALVVRFGKPGAGALKTIEQVVARLAYDHRYAELLDFVRSHLELVERAATRRLPIQRLRAWLRPSPWLLAQELAVAVDPGWTKLRRSLVGAMRGLLKPLYALLPSLQREADSADTIARTLYGSRPLLKFMVSERPSFLPELLRRSLHHRFEFSNRLLEAMLQTPGSLLFDELHDNQNLNRNNGYVIPPSNVLLSAYFADAHVAADLHAYKPVGDEVLRLHGPAITDAYRTFMNGNASHFDEERWRDPTHAGIWFFDVMVRAALEQDVHDHMWLYYLPIFVDRLEANFDPAALDLDPHTEFPSRSAQLIYYCFSTIQDWIGMRKAAPARSTHAEVPKNFHEGTASIPAGAAIVLGDCLRRVAMSDRLPYAFRLSMFEMTLRGVRKMAEEDNNDPLLRFLIVSLLQGGRTAAHLDYANRLHELFVDTDHVLRSGVTSFKDGYAAMYKQQLL